MLTKALSNAGVMPRIGTFWLEAAVAFSHHASSMPLKVASTQQSAWLMQPVHVNVILEKVQVISLGPSRLAELVDLVRRTSRTDLSNHAGAGIVNLDLKFSHAMVDHLGSLRFIDFDTESTYHLAGKHVGPDCRMCVYQPAPRIVCIPSVVLHHDLV